MKKMVLIIAAAFVMSGCGEKEYDESFYQAHHEKAEEMLKRCEAGEVSGKNCENARAGLDKFNAKKMADILFGKAKS